MKIYIDFDRTLFDCDCFLGDFYTLISQYLIPKDIFKECQIQCKKYGFNPYLILQKVEEKCDFDNKIYQDVDLLLQNTINYLYSDSISFLDYLKSCNYEVIILTRGNTEYQEKKILNSGVKYDKLIITMEHKGNLDIDYKNGVFIDDNPKEIQSILKNKPKKIIAIRRNDTKYEDIEINKSILMVSSLGEIIENKIL